MYLSTCIAQNGDHDDVLAEWDDREKGQVRALRRRWTNSRARAYKIASGGLIHELQLRLRTEAGNNEFGETIMQLFGHRLDRSPSLSIDKHMCDST